MPHLRIEYSTNIAGRFDPALLVQVTTDVLVASGVFSPPDAIKVRLIPVEHFRVGSGADHGFNLPRPAAAKSRATPRTASVTMYGT